MAFCDVCIFGVLLTEDVSNWSTTRASYILCCRRVVSLCEKTLFLKLELTTRRKNEKYIELLQQRSTYSLHKWCLAQYLETIIDSLAPRVKVFQHITQTTHRPVPRWVRNVNLFVALFTPWTKHCIFSILTISSLFFSSSFFLQEPNDFP